MSIWDDLYKDLVASELKAESSDEKDKFDTVEAKVSELRKRVGLNSNTTSKTAALNKAAQQEFRLVIAEDKTISNKDESDLIELKSYLAVLIGNKKASIDPTVALSNVSEAFPQHTDLIRNHKHELFDFINSQLAKYKILPNSPTPTPNTVKIEPTEDSKIFENIADKLRL